MRSKTLSGTFLQVLVVVFPERNNVLRPKYPILMNLKVPQLKSFNCLFRRLMKNSYWKVKSQIKMFIIEKKTSSILMRFNLVGQNKKLLLFCNEPEDTGEVLN